MASYINKLYYRQNPAHKSLIIYGRKEKLDEFCSVITIQRRKFRVDHIISQDVGTGAILNLIDKSHSVFFLEVDENKLEGLLEYCYLYNKHTYIQPTFSKILLNAAGTMWLSNTPVFTIKNPEHTNHALRLPRRAWFVAGMV